MTRFRTRTWASTLIAMASFACSSGGDAQDTRLSPFDDDTNRDPRPSQEEGGNTTNGDVGGGADYNAGSSDALASGNSVSIADQAQESIAGLPPSDIVAPEDPDSTASPSVNPFVMVAYDPLSTFAVDVDTASYDLFRQSVQGGRLPSPSTVRPEEYINYFRYDYPAPEHDSEVPFAVALAAAPNIVSQDTALLRVGIQGKQPPPEESKPANLVFLVDASGSMSQEMPLVKRVLQDTLSELQPTDTISIVTYASNAGLRLAPTPVSDRTSIETEIAGMDAGGSTNGAGGINLAYEQAEDAFIEGGINHVILCTDGDFNVGASSDQALVELITEKRRSGVTFTALGFGTSGVNDSMLEATSNAGNGFYAVITNEDQAAEYVSDRLLSTLHLIAKDVKIQVEFNPELVSAYRLLGYENRDIADNDFRNDVVDAGEIGADHQVTALYEVVLSGTDLPAREGAPAPQDGEAFDGAREVSAEDMVLVKVRYKDVDASEEDAAYEVSSSLAPEDIAASWEDASDDLAWAISVASFAELMRESPFSNAAHLEPISQVFTQLAADDTDRGEFLQLFNTARGMMTATE